MMRPLTGDEVRVLRDRFIRCSAHPDPADWPYIESVSLWLATYQSPTHHGE